PGKPANIVEQIVDGKMNKFYATSCLLEQAFIKNPDQTVTQLIADKNKALGESIVVRNFLRFTVGEELPTA
ncbi:MAG: translation elongation factor Ts, partial [Verrucomicrobiota bacterium]